MHGRRRRIPYLRIADHIRERILTGQLAAGAQLPSLAALREEFGYSHGVGQNAYRLLESEGLVVARHGRGYYVRSQEPPTVLVRRQRVPAATAARRRPPSPDRVSPVLGGTNLSLVPPRPASRPGWKSSPAIR